MISFNDGVPFPSPLPAPTFTPPSISFDEEGSSQDLDDRLGCQNPSKDETISFRKFRMAAWVAFVSSCMMSVSCEWKSPYTLYERVWDKLGESSILHTVTIMTFFFVFVSQKFLTDFNPYRERIARINQIANASFCEIVKTSLDNIIKESLLDKIVENLPEKTRILFYNKFIGLYFKYIENENEKIQRKLEIEFQYERNAKTLKIFLFKNLIDTTDEQRNKIKFWKQWRTDELNNTHSSFNAIKTSFNQTFNRLKRDIISPLRG